MENSEIIKTKLLEIFINSRKEELEDKKAIWYDENNQWMFSVDVRGFCIRYSADRIYEIFKKEYHTLDIFDLDSMVRKTLADALNATIYCVMCSYTPFPKKPSFYETNHL